MRRLLSLLTLSIIALVSIMPSAVAQASIVKGGVSIRLVDVPEELKDDSRARSYIVDHLAPGTEIMRRIEIKNNAPQEQKVSLYAGPAEIKNGIFSPGDPGTQNELSEWIAFNETEIMIAPSEKKIVEVKINVTPDAAPGERYGVVFAHVEGVKPEGGGAAVSSRTGIRVYLSVGEGNPPAADFSIEKINGARNEKDEPIITAIIKNIGGRGIDVSGVISLSEGPGATTAGPFPAKLGTTIAPGTEQKISVVVDPKLSTGPWKANIELKSGSLVKVGSGTITFPDPNRMIYIILALLLILLIVAYLIYRRYHTKKKAFAQEKIVQEAVDAALAEASLQSSSTALDTKDTSISTEIAEEKKKDTNDKDK